MDRLEINQKIYSIVKTFSNNKAARIRLKDSTLFLSIPLKWPEKEKIRVSNELLKKAIEKISSGKWTSRKLPKKLCFKPGQELFFYDGTKITLNFLNSNSISSTFENSALSILAPQTDRFEEFCSEIVKLEISKIFLPKIKERVEFFNKTYFSSKIDYNNIRLADNSSLWGSCASKSRISLNFKLLFFPKEVLDYVIVHELAHTKYASHGERFWQLVERVLPDYRTASLWLKKNSHAHLSNFFK